MRKIKKNKSSNYMLIGITYIVMILTISTAYSFLNENLSISTGASISQDGKDYVIDNTIITEEEIEGVYYYEYDVVLTYKGETPTTGWEVYIQIPFDSEIIECYNAASCVVEGEALTIKNDTTNGVLSPDNTSTTFSFKFKTSDPDYVFNALGAKFFTDGGTTDPDVPDNPDPDNPGSDLPVVEEISGVLTLLYDWVASKQYVLTIENASDTYAITSFVATVYIPEGFEVNTAWSAVWSFDPETRILTMSGPDWDPTIPPSSKIEINIQLTTPTEDQPYLVDFVGVNENGEQVRFNTEGKAVAE